MDYHLLREFADSWFLIFLFVFFIGVFLWVFRPGARKTYEDTSAIPFRNEDKPASSEASGSRRTPQE
ncbi:CcoQ/FixQ family Cbb3-type cytochrome c oxidase assembly chaperone [Thioclava atlantica]|uniref:Cytochrome c oxidase, cbb3-type subunit IV n=1 Tax=Thioclava atlantica TaxID=1317124 RepID=A0A085TSK8_9RHOB|nr:CcoQ/FixQ family Cbb3-type cytochrome c oxidase assembly chaperone [Thioclava atlantica]KFE33705.1 cytochrome c oxidase, cbb3-type subunit IV [Thioclava atlantica]